MTVRAWIGIAMAVLAGGVAAAQPAPTKVIQALQQSDGG